MCKPDPDILRFWEEWKWRWDLEKTNTLALMSKDISFKNEK